MAACREHKRSVANSPVCDTEAECWWCRMEATYSRQEAEIDRLKAELHELRGLLKTAWDAFDVQVEHLVPPTWMKTVDAIIEKGGDDE